MKTVCIPTPCEEDWNAIADGFNQRSNFPNCIGAVDGKHIRMINPKFSGSSYRNYKNYFSIVLLAVADSNYSFIYVDVGSYGKDSDPTIFRNSTLCNKIDNDSLELPPSNQVPGITDPIPYAFVGDEAFGLSKHLLRPYSGTYLSTEKRIFNYRLSRARRYVECSFGILSNKWRILHRPIDVNLDFAVDIVKCCCVLHNFVRKRDGYIFEDTFTITGLDDGIPVQQHLHINRNINYYRNLLTNYFISDEGKLPWQNERI